MSASLVGSEMCIRDSTIRTLHTDVMPWTCRQPWMLLAATLARRQAGEYFNCCTIPESVVEAACDARESIE
eukprot:6775514-Alexandrium_andersonii.AAC.1